MNFALSVTASSTFTHNKHLLGRFVALKHWIGTESLLQQPFHRHCNKYQLSQMDPRDALHAHRVVRRGRRSV